MASQRQLKGKLNTVRNIGQITKAMQMVAANKMRRSQDVALRARPFAKEALRLLLNILSHAEKENLLAESHFFKRTERKTTCLVVITSDKGLAGGFNSAVLRRSIQFLNENPGAEIVTVGKKAQGFFQNRKIAVARSFTDFSDTATLSGVAPLTDWLLEKYTRHEYDMIAVCSTIFVSALVQRVEVTGALPLTIEGLETLVARIIPKQGKYSDWAQQEEEGQDLPLLLEPSQESVFAYLLEDLFRVEMLYLVLESNASEHSARMVAMKNATENASSLAERLLLELNKARQTSITQELTEIATAKEALTAD